MAAGLIDGLGTGALGHHPLRVDRDHLVVGRHQIPARLALPGRHGRLAIQGGDTPGDLRVSHECRDIGLHIGRERGGELRVIERQEAVLRRQDRRHRRAGSRIGDQLADRFTLVGRERCDVDQPRDLRIGARFGDDDATIGMTDQNDIAVGGGDGALGDGNVVGQGGGRVLDDADLVAVPLQDLVDAFPSRTVDETAVDEDDRLDRDGLSLGRGDRGGGEAQRRAAASNLVTTDIVVLLDVYFAIIFIAIIIV